MFEVLVDAVIFGGLFGFKTVRAVDASAIRHSPLLVHLANQRSDGILLSALPSSFLLAGVDRRCYCV